MQYEFLPSAASIVDEVVPASFKVKLFKCFLDAAVSEQIARRVAMKNATENAETMIGSLSIAYNRARQGQITGELLEIIGGAGGAEQITVQTPLPPLRRWSAVFDHYDRNEQTSPHRPRAGGARV